MDSMTRERGMRRRGRLARRVVCIGVLSCAALLVLWEMAMRRDSAREWESRAPVAAFQGLDEEEEEVVSQGRQEEEDGIARKDGRAAMLEEAKQSWLRDKELGSGGAAGPLGGPTEEEWGSWRGEGEIPWTEPIPHWDSFIEGVEYERKHVECYVPPSQERCLPSVVIAGFPKCGTAQLLSDLGHCHPQIVAAAGEPHGLFRRHNAYLRLLPKVLPSDQQLLIESTPSYASSPDDLLRKASRMLPGLKTIILVRDPVERDYSHFRMALRDGDITASYLGTLGISDCTSNTSRCLVDVLAHVILDRMEWRQCFEERSRQVGTFLLPLSAKDVVVLVQCVEEFPYQHWNVAQLPFLLDGYAEGVAAFQEVFRDRFHLIISEEFYSLTDNPWLVDELTSFLGLDTLHTMTSCFLALGNEKSIVNKEFETAHGINVTPLSPEARKLLGALHQPGIVALEALLGRTLPWTSEAL